MLKFNNQDLINAVNDSFSIAEVIRKLGGNLSGGIYPRIKKLIQELNINTSHFTGQNWRKDKNLLTDIRLIGKYSKDDIFSSKSCTARSHVKDLIIKNNLIEYKCSECGIKEWRNKKLSLHLEHKNGIRNDNRLENLTFLCPNCHSLTNTYCGKNNYKNPIDEKEILDAAKNCANIRQILQKLNLSDGVNYNRIKRILNKYNFIFPVIIKDKIIVNPNWRKEPKVNQRKVVRPSKDELFKLVWEKPCIQITKDLGLKSSTTINKWCKSYKISKPSRGYWAKIYGSMAKQQDALDLDSSGEIRGDGNSSTATISSSVDNSYFLL